MIKHIVNLGAINKETNNYEYPSIASKSSIYKCPDCSKDVIFKKGLINRPHFAHYKSDNPCHRYDAPTESQIHKDGKNIIYTLLQKETPIRMIKHCKSCGIDKGNGKIKYEDTCQPALEYSFKLYGKPRIADVALGQDNTPIFIFEILNTHRTKEDTRPEPWYEIDANKLIADMNSGPSYNSKDELLIYCVRDYECKICYSNRERIRLWNIEKANRRYKYVMEKLRREQEQQAIQNKINYEQQELEIQNRRIQELEIQNRRIQEQVTINSEQVHKISDANHHVKLEQETKVEAVKVFSKRDSQIAELKVSMVKGCYCFDWFKCHSCVCINYEISKLTPWIPS